MSDPDISVVIPTRDRPEALARCLRAVLAQETRRSYEIVVVDDGSGVDPPDDPRVHVLRSPGRGPATARNIGLHSARGAVVLFTDDDTIPAAQWLEAAAEALDRDQAAVGVEGPTETPAYDALYERSVSNGQPGAYFTCNIAYRRSTLLEEGGFDELFPDAHCEDLDLGRRMLRRGPIAFSDAMRVVHPPHPLPIGELIRRARRIESTWRLYRKHPETNLSRWPVRWTPLMATLHRWRRLAMEEKVIGRSPRRALRLGLLAGTQISLTLKWTLLRWRDSP